MLLGTWYHSILNTSGHRFAFCFVNVKVHEVMNLNVHVDHHREGTAPLKLRKTNRRALTKFHCRCYLWVCGVQKVWKLKISDEGFLIFPIFWKKKWKKSGKKFSKKIFFLLKFVFRARKSICTTFCFEFFFCLGVRRLQKSGQIHQNCRKSIFVDQNQKKKFKTKSSTYAFSSSEKQVLVKKKIWNFFSRFF